MGERTELLYKVLLVGDVGVGKTSLVKRYSKEKWAPNTKPTIGVDFVLKELENVVAPNTFLRVQLWDVAGQERFKSITRVYYSGAVAAVVVFDVTQRQTLEGVVDWKQDLDNKVTQADGSPIPCVLLANKCDLEDQVVSKEELLAFSKKHKFDNFFFVSAKTGANVNESMEWLMHRVYDTSQLKGKSNAPRKEGPRRIELKTDLSGRLKTLRVGVLGVRGCGKTSMLNRLTKNTFGATRRTLEIERQTKTLQLDNERANAELWEVPADLVLTPQQCQELVGTIVVFDSTEPSSLQPALKLKAAFDAKHPNTPSILLSNKTDLPESNLLPPDRVKKLCTEHNFINFYDTSAQTAQNISEALHELCNHILRTNPKAGAPQTEKKKGCC